MSLSSFVAVSVFATILLSSSALPSLDVVGTANVISTCPELCWSLTAPPAYSSDSRDYYTSVTYHNGFGTSLEGTVYFVMRNQLGQTVAIDSTTTTAATSGNVTLHPSIISHLLPPGNYSTYLFAVSNATGVAISNETVGSLESTYQVFLNTTQTSFGASSGPIDFSRETITSVSPNQLIVNVTFIATDPHTNQTVGRNQTEISIPPMSTGVVPGMLVGTGNLSHCMVDVVMFMQDQNGKNLAPPANASPDCER